MGECGAWRQNTIMHAARSAGRLAQLKPEELSQLVASYMDTDAMRQLYDGRVAGMQHPAGYQLWEAIRAALSAMLQLCTEVTGLARKYQTTGRFIVPQYEGVFYNASAPLPAPPPPAALTSLDTPAPPPPPGPLSCNGKRIHLVAISMTVVKTGPSPTNDMPGTFRFRGLGFASYMMRAGHRFSLLSTIRDERHFASCKSPSFQFPFAPGRPAAAVYPGDAPGDPPWHVIAYFVKFKSENIARCFRHHKVPVVHDLVDGKLEYRNYQLSDLILATNRLSAELYTLNTGLRAVPLPHQPANTFGFHRADRTRPVSVVAMTHQPEHHSAGMVEMTAKLTEYVKGHKARAIKLRVGSYVGHGFDQEEYRQFLQSKYDPSDQMGYSMGFSSVDIMVIWLPCYVPELVCVKPTTRMLTALSLGIPTILIGSTSYLDLAVEYGYPLIATSSSHAIKLLDLLVRDGKLRQAVSELGLRVAARFSLDAIGAEFERQVCSLV